MIRNVFIYVSKKKTAAIFYWLQKCSYCYLVCYVWYKKDSLGVRVEILERHNQLLPPIIFDTDVIVEPKSNQWNSYL